MMLYRDGRQIFESPQEMIYRRGEDNKSNRQIIAKSVNIEVSISVIYLNRMRIF
jgi:hypothetical protein